MADTARNGVPADVAAFVEDYRAALERFDAEAVAARYGYPSMMLTDTFVGVAGSQEELVAGLARANEGYAALGATAVAAEGVAIEEVRPSFVRLRVTWRFVTPGESADLTAAYEYTLRRGDDGLRPYVVLSLDPDAGGARGLTRPVRRMATA